MLDVELFLQPQRVPQTAHAVLRIYRRLSHFLCCSVYLSGNEVSDSFTHSFGRAVVKAVSRWSLTAEVGIGSQVSTSEICDRQSGTATGVSPRTLV